MEVEGKKGGGRKRGGSIRGRGVNGRGGGVGSRGGRGGNRRGAVNAGGGDVVENEEASYGGIRSGSGGGGLRGGIANRGRGVGRGRRVSNGGVQRGGTSNVGLQQGEVSNGGFQQGGASNVDVQEGEASNVGFQQGGTSNVGVKRGGATNVGIKRGRGGVGCRGALIRRPALVHGVHGVASPDDGPTRESKQEGSTISPKKPIKLQNKISGIKTEPLSQVNSNKKMRKTVDSPATKRSYVKKMIEPKVRQCAICKIKMKTHWGMNSHMRIHKTVKGPDGLEKIKPIKKNQCPDPVCRRQFTNHFGLNSHKRIHREKVEKKGFKSASTSTSEIVAPPTYDSPKPPLSPPPKRRQEPKDYRTMNRRPGFTRKSSRSKSSTVKVPVASTSTGGGGHEEDGLKEEGDKVPDADELTEKDDLPVEESPKSSNSSHVVTQNFVKVKPSATPIPVASTSAGAGGHEEDGFKEEDAMPEEDGFKDEDAMPEENGLKDEDALPEEDGFKDEDALPEQDELSELEWWQEIDDCDWPENDCWGQRYGSPAKDESPKLANPSAVASHNFVKVMPPAAPIPVASTSTGGGGHEEDGLPPKLANSNPVATHNRIKDKPFMCDKCPFRTAFENQSHLMLHVELTHDGKWPVRCDFCYGSFAIGQLEYHVKEVHPEKYEKFMKGIDEESDGE